jgi:hypothetical protein
LEETTLRRLRIHTTKAQLALCELICRSLAKERSSENLTADQKAAIVERWITTTTERRDLRLLLESQESAQLMEQPVNCLN